MWAPGPGEAAARVRAMLRAVRSGVRLRADEGEGHARVDPEGSEESLAVSGLFAGGEAGDRVPLGLHAAEARGSAGQAPGVDAAAAHRGADGGRDDPAEDL